MEATKPLAKGLATDFVIQAPSHQKSWNPLTWSIRGAPYIGGVHPYCGGVVGLSGQASLHLRPEALHDLFVCLVRQPEVTHDVIDLQTME